MSIVAIDGPGGAGKSTLARALAQRLGLEHLDTGAMYRAVALAALNDGVTADDAVQLASIARAMDLVIGERVLLDGEDVTEAIRSDAVNDIVSSVAAHKDIRAELVARQRAWVRARDGAVVEGRDIGSVVLPDADLKVFLTADPDERARRRAHERGRSGAVADEAASIASRDAQDGSRRESPLVVASDAVVIDSTQRSVGDLVEELLLMLEER